MVEAQDFQEEQKNNESSDLLVNNGNADEASDADPVNQPSSFYSQIPFSSQQMLNGAKAADGDEEGQNLHLFQMMGLLHNEKMAPELLPFQFSLIETLLRLISNREQMIEQSNSVDVDDRFTINIYRMELERVKFVMKSYLRVRLAKIERNLIYIIEKDRSELLSEAEKIFAFNILENRKKHFQQSFFEKVPKELNVLE